MKTLFASAILGCTLICPSVVAQHGGPPGNGGGAPARPPSAVGSRPSHPEHPNNTHDFITGLRPERNGFAAAGYNPWGWGWGLPGSYFGYGDWGNSNCNEPAPTQVVMMPRGPQISPAPPAVRPEVAQPVTHEYKWDEPTQAGSDAFALVLKNGSIQYAIAVWISDGVLHYTAQDGTESRIALASLDRPGTQRANAENRLRLSIQETSMSQ